MRVPLPAAMMRMSSGVMKKKVGLRCKSPARRHGVDYRLRPIRHKSPFKPSPLASPRQAPQANGAG